jgi:predicted dehydrogenase
MAAPAPGSGPVGVAVIGCGTISDQYLRNLTAFPDLRVLFCADLDGERARSQAAAYGVPAAGTVEQALDYPGVELVVNLTIPAAHAAVSLAAVAAGKSVWTEKPLALDTAAGTRLLADADRAGVLVGCAPDTVLGAGLQTARRLIADGAIGQPQTALALMQNPGPDLWHPDPEFLFRRGAGPLFDIGPYYLSALATIFGPAAQVAAVGRRARERRVIGRGPRAGTAFDVEVFTQVSALIEYAQGPAATLVLSFDSPLRRHGFLEITGTEATLALPDPNMFDGALRIKVASSDDWTELPAAGATDGRGLGVLDLAQALRSGAPVRASGEIGLHVLDTMEAIERSITKHAFEPVRTSFGLPDALEPGWDPKARTVAEDDGRAQDGRAQDGRAENDGA